MSFKTLRRVSRLRSVFASGFLLVSGFILVGGATCAVSAHAAVDYVGERNSFNRFHGQGTYTYRNGTVYEGQWVDGRKQGQGRQTNPDGSVYNGQWSDNEQNGLGRMRFSNGDTYEGGWSAGRMHGKGVFTFANGDRYEGGFIGGKEEGTGVFTRKNGERYEGQWKSGRRDGSGTLVRPGVGSIAGTWRADAPVAPMTVTFSNGDQFIGNLQNLAPNGKGTCKTKGATSECEYRNGKRLEPVVAPVANAKTPEAPTAKPVVKVLVSAAPVEQAAVSVSEKPAVPPAPVEVTKADEKATAKAIAKAESGGRKLTGVLSEGMGVAAADGAKALKDASSAREGSKPAAVPPTKEPNPLLKADIVRSTSVANGVPMPLATSLAGKVIAVNSPRVVFKQDWSGAAVLVDESAGFYAKKDNVQIGDLRIYAESKGVSVTLMVDEYLGPGVYPLKYFKASITKDGASSYRTAAAQPGELVVTQDDGKVIKGTFRFVGYPTGNPEAGSGKTVSDGAFVIPLK